MGGREGERERGREGGREGGKMVCMWSNYYIVATIYYTTVNKQGDLLIMLEGGAAHPLHHIWKHSIMLQYLKNPLIF